MRKNAKRIRYAVVGLGWIAQESILPAFAHAENCEMTTLISDDRRKLAQLGKTYKVSRLFSYEDYEPALAEDVDAVFIALPNSLHCEYTVRAAQAGIHVLCEKPMAMSERECVQMTEACIRNEVKLMVAYRLHFEEGNLKALHIAQSGKLGDLRIFNSTYTMSVKEDNVRLDPRRSGGTLFDIGIYCINAARSIFASEPQEVFAYSTTGRHSHTQSTDEMTMAILRFPQERLASFVCSFAASAGSMYEIIGERGRVRVEPAFHHKGDVKLQEVSSGAPKPQKFPARDQFAAEMVYFSNCILMDREPEPSGKEGLADVRIIRALYRSAKEGRPIYLEDLSKNVRPSLRQAIYRPEGPTPRLIHAREPGKK